MPTPTNSVSIIENVYLASPGPNGLYMWYPVYRLYRGILRAHRRLPYMMRAMGDDYVKAGALSDLDNNGALISNDLKTLKR